MYEYVVLSSLDNGRVHATIHIPSPSLTYSALVISITCQPHPCTSVILSELSPISGTQIPA